MEKLLTTPFQMKWRWKSVWQHDFKWNEVKKSFDNMISNEMKLKNRLTTPFQMKWRWKIVWQHRFKWNEGEKAFDNIVSNEMKVKKRLTTSFQTKWRWKSVWQHRFKWNGGEKTFDNVVSNEMEGWTGAMRKDGRVCLQHYSLSINGVVKEDGGTFVELSGVLGGEHAQCSALWKTCSHISVARKIVLQTCGNILSLRYYCDTWGHKLLYLGLK